MARNVGDLRADRRLTVRALSERTERLGQRLLPSAITKVEKHRRSVSATELLVLALALDTTPNRLVLSPTADQEQLALTPSTVASTARAWAWACGDHKLPDVWSQEDVNFDLDRERRYRRESAPHRPEGAAIEALGKHADALAKVAHAVNRVMDDGVALVDIVSYLSLLDTSQRLIKRELGRSVSEGGDGER